MRKKRAAALRSEAFSGAGLFGPPPLLEGEDAAAYDELLTRVSSAVRPTDFIEEIWVRDLTDVFWSILRLRRIQAAHLSAEVSDEANDKASSLAEARTELMEGTEKIEMRRLLDSHSGLSWETRVAQNPRADEKFQELWASAKATLDMTEIQAKIMVHELDTVERIEHLIMLEQQRFDAVIREMDRHRVTQKLRESDQGIEEAEFKIVKPKTAIRKITNKKAA
jgi:hypothetical protein